MGNTRARPRGLRHSTRYLFSRDFRKKGFIPLRTYMRTYKLGDYVDIKANPAQQKGMPFRHYHGRTGRVWNVSPRAVGVEVNKLVGNRIIKKRIHVRLEHVTPSRCREDFEKRKRENDRLRAEARKHGEKPPLLKRQPEQPKGGELVTNVAAETVTPVPFDIIREGISSY